MNGKIISIAGRSLYKDLVPVVKYVDNFSCDEPFFFRGRDLYGLNQTAEFVRKTGEIILVEGFMDVIRMWQEEN